jgi:hypothetical protein
MLACATHLGESLAFGAPPVLLVGVLVVITLRDRRQVRREERAASRVDGEGAPAQ